MTSHSTIPVESRSKPHRGTCRVCGKPLDLLLDFGPQPLCNRLLMRPTDQERRHRLQLGQCVECGLLQLIEPIAAIELKAARPLRYTEPEAHLDQVADFISRLPGIETNAPICGITAKDQSTVERLRARGFHNVRCLLTGEDLGIEDPAAGIETIQQQISNEVLDARVFHLGRYRVVIARHILEHAHAMDRFMVGLQRLLAPGGYLVIEVPDFTTSLLNGDYSTLWEEHVVYFTSATLSHSLQLLGLSIQHLQTYPYTPEDSLVAVATAGPFGHEGERGDGGGSQRRPSRTIADLQSGYLHQETARGAQYAMKLPNVQERWRQMLMLERGSGRQVALLGAGHLGTMFINLMNLADIIDFVVDDDPEKIGLYLPGSHHLIHEISALEDHAVDLCLLSVSPEGEERVLQRHSWFVDRGGRFGSIFPSSRLACIPGPLDIPAKKR